MRAVGSLTQVSAPRAPPWGRGLPLRVRRLGRPVPCSPPARRRRGCWRAQRLLAAPLLLLLLLLLLRPQLRRGRRLLEACITVGPIPLAQLGEGALSAERAPRELAEAGVELHPAAQHGRRVRCPPRAQRRSLRAASAASASASAAAAASLPCA